MWKDCETELDFLDFDYLVNVLNEVINDDSLLPSAIGVYGDWGSGKSSLIRMSIRELEKIEGTVCLSFNGWLFESYQDAKTAILGSVLDVIKEKRTLSEKAKKCFNGLVKSVDKFKLATAGIKLGVSALLGGGIPSLSTIPFENMLSTGITTALSGVESMDEGQLEKIRTAVSDELNSTKLREDIRGFQEKFEELLEETKIKRLVVFIDELDRCSPDTILDTLEAVRLFLFRGKVSFIIGADERHIQYAVKRKFAEIQGVDFDIGKEYLEKLVQYPIKIPRLDGREMEFYISCLFLQKSISAEDFSRLIAGIRDKKNSVDGFSLDFSTVEALLPEQSTSDLIKGNLMVARQLSQVLANGLHGNPRQCKRFLNSLSMRESMAKFKFVTLRRDILAKIMMLEYFRPQAFRKFAALHAEGKLVGELHIIEADGLVKSEHLQEWSKDGWMDNWVKNEPLLEQANLRPYFYFTRDALTNRTTTNLHNLSTQAMDVLAKLKSKADTQVYTALQAASDINDHESVEILTTIFNDMNNEASVDIQHFKAFLLWGASKQCLYGEAFSLLKSIPTEKIRLPFIPLIGEFGRKTDQKGEIKRWLDSIKFTDSIQKAIGQLEA